VSAHCQVKAEKSRGRGRKKSRQKKVEAEKSRGRKKSRQKKAGKKPTKPRECVTTVTLCPVASLTCVAKVRWLLNTTPSLATFSILLLDVSKQDNISSQQDSDKTTGGHMPYEVLYGIRLDVSHLRAVERCVPLSSQV